jgi:ribonuclease G
MEPSLFLVNVEGYETRLAEVRGGRLWSLDVDRGGRLLGDICKGRVANIVRGMDAAFVDVGLERNALIYVGDVGAAQAGADKRSLSIEQLLRPGDEVVVQVARPPVGSKGARVTARLSLPGRTVVLSTLDDTVGVSRRIEDEDERARLRKVAERLRPLDHGIIVRTEAEGASESEMARDIAQLLGQLQQLRERAQFARAPARLHRDMGLLGRLVRDRLPQGAQSVAHRIVCDDAETHELLRALLTREEAQKPSAIRLEMHEGPVPLFRAFKVEQDIERAADRTVRLPSGGGLVVDEAEALTAIDVNTGRFVGRGRLSDTVVATNLEAVEEVARQMRLRDLGGVIVVDFIDMDRTKDRIRVLNALEAAVSQDRVKTRIVQLSPSGLVEMTRRREGQSLRQALNRPCPYCGGDGVVKTPQTVALQARRRVREACASEPGEPASPKLLRVVLHPECACALLETEGEGLSGLEASTSSLVHLAVDFSMHTEGVRVSALQAHEAQASSQAWLPGALRPLPARSALYPRSEPQFAVLQGALVHLENVHDANLDKDGATLRPLLLDIVSASRWFVTARVCAAAADQDERSS